MATSALSSHPFVLDHALYSEDSLREACDAYRRFAGVIVERGKGQSSVSLTPLDSGADPKLLRREFLNYVLDLSIKRHFNS